MPVIRGSSPYGNFLADDEPDHPSESFRAGAESSLSMVSDYTLSYGTDALEPARMVQNQDGRFVPSYVALDRKVLRFHVYFRDPRGPIGYTVRKATLFHFLEDGSTKISEKRMENSGIVTGELVRRHRLPIPGSPGEYYSAQHLDVGVEVAAYGRTFRIVDADEFTREFYGLNGMPRRPPEAMPDDYVENDSRAPPPVVHSYPDVVFQTQGLTDRFLNLDRKVLRFYCSWDDQRAFGDEERYVLNYFLVDDTVEILEVHTPNDGKDPWNSLLKRRPLYKGLPRQTIETEEDRKRNPQPRWHWTELSIGTVIQVYNRDILIRDCDQFTRDWMQKNGLPQPDPLTPEPPAVQEFKRKIPPHLGFGSAEDSMQTVINPIMPKALKKNFVKALTNNSKVMRFRARILTAVRENDERDFVISFFLDNDEISIYERPTCNTFTGLKATRAGFQDGSKFLERGPVLRPDSDRITPKYYTLADVQQWEPGAKVVINRFTFEILGADEYTSHLLAGSGPKLDPHKTLLLSKIKQEMRKIAIRIEDQFEFCDRKDDGVISADELDMTLKGMAIRISESEVYELISIFDTDGDGVLSLPEFRAMVTVL